MSIITAKEGTKGAGGIATSLERAVAPHPCDLRPRVPSFTRESNDVKDGEPLNPEFARSRRGDPDISPEPHWSGFAAVDLASMAGLDRSAVICEIVNEDGSMARCPDLVRFCSRHGLKMVAITGLVRYRYNHESDEPRPGIDFPLPWRSNRARSYHRQRQEDYIHAL
jgi:hypothetical protein